MDSLKESCDIKYRSVSSIYHTSETLFWAMFGLIDLSHFTLKENHFLTEWTGKTIFGSYSCCSIIVLLNMLIAMMSNSYQYISVTYTDNDRQTRTEFYVRSPPYSEKK
ncbi:unnamed protein product [Cylicostephanus goldi]|uniref:Ion transport domain-containing protein n=1 Tax=Cylicostephanus goldi TaxID=71465 RepID=A0A3P7N2T7_CYLGO|nr:unnamed protein product [Cylicostephanus goldi]